MTHPQQDPQADPGLDESRWAFGTGFADPLAGLDAGVPDDVDARALAAYSLMLGDDALVASHRLAQWCGSAHDLEDDIALANLALDLLGQARLLLARAAAADPAIVPVLPEGSPVPAEDALAFFREAAAFRNVRLVEAENGDFAVTIARLVLFATHRLALMERLAECRDPALAAVAAKAVPELAYHRGYAARWFVTLARGTAESRCRLLTGLELVWPFHDELFASDEVERTVAAQGVGVDPAEVATEVGAVLDQLFTAAGIDRPEVAQAGRIGGGAGRAGRHTEALGRMLAPMQAVARAHPRGQW